MKKSEHDDDDEKNSIQVLNELISHQKMSQEAIEQEGKQLPFF